MTEEGKSNGVIYVQVSKDEYSRLIAARERLEILKGYMKSIEFPEINAIITILGIKEEEANE